MYKCSNPDCSATKKHIQYLGRCPECGEFNTMKEVNEESSKVTKKMKDTESDLSIKSPAELQGIKIHEVPKDFQAKSYERIITKDEGLNTFFGGGIVLGSVNLISGLPGVGKSTFLLDMAKFVPEKSICYISGEENIYQILSRAERMSQDDFHFENVTVYNEKLLENIIHIIAKENPDIVIIDSLQVLESVSQDGEIGGLKQQKYITKKLISYLKEANIPTFLVGHVNSDGSISGAMFVEHLVDSVIKIEPATERGDSLKVMKNLKNRFSGSEIVCYELNNEGITIISPEKLAQVFIEESALDSPGSVLTAVQIGNQIFLSEVQSLVTKQEFNFAERLVTAYNKDKFKILLKIIGEHIYKSIYNCDVATNIISPLRYNTSDIDLAIILSILSQINKFTLGKKVVIGQVGFNGEIKSVARQGEVIQKLQKLGFKKSDIISNVNYKNIQSIVKKFGRAS